MGWKSAVPAFALAAAAALVAASPAAAQTYGFVRVGNTGSPDDPFCEDPVSLFTSISAGITAPLAGFSVEYNNGDWPWPEEAPANGSGPLFLTHGRSFQFMGELNPVQFFTSGLSRYARPFIGLGLHISTDGEERPDTGEGPAYGVKGQTRPFIAYGVNGILPVGTRFGLTAGYRGTTILFGDFEFNTPSGAVVKTDGSSLSSHTWTVGFTVQVGNN